VAQDRIEAHRQGVSTSNGNGNGCEALVRVRLADQNKAVVQSVVVNTIGAYGVQSAESAFISGQKSLRPLLCG
jgi:hypothetical protein